MRHQFRSVTADAFPAKAGPTVEVCQSHWGYAVDEWDWLQPGRGHCERYQFCSVTADVFPAKAGPTVGVCQSHWGHAVDS